MSSNPSEQIGSSNANDSPGVRSESRCVPSNSGTEACVVILGTFRSGTSAVAGILDTLGVRMGPRNPNKDWMERRSWNPTGNYENLNFRLLDYRALGIDERMPQNSLPDDWPTRLRAMPSDEARQVVRSAEGGVWGWKHPYTTLTLPLYFPFLKNPMFIVVRRDPTDVVKSLQRQDWVSQDAGFRLTHIVMHELESDLKRYSAVPRVELTFDELLMNPDGSIERLVAFLGLNPSPALKRRALAFVRPRSEIAQASKRLAVRELTRFGFWLASALTLEIRLGPRRPKVVTETCWRRFMHTYLMAVQGQD